MNKRRRASLVFFAFGASMLPALMSYEVARRFDWWPGVAEAAVIFWVVAMVGLVAIGVKIDI